MSNEWTVTEVGPRGTARKGCAVPRKDEWSTVLFAFELVCWAEQEAVSSLTAADDEVVRYQNNRLTSGNNLLFYPKQLFLRRATSKPPSCLRFFRTRVPHKVDLMLPMQF